jgi:hypothetical protein
MKWNEESCRSVLAVDFTDFLITSSLCPSGLLRCYDPCPSLRAALIRPRFLDATFFPNSNE